MFKRIVSTAIVLNFIVVSGFADAKGTSGAQFLKVVASPRASALGSAYTAYCDDVNSIAFNPAGMAFISKAEVAVVQNNWIQDITNQYAAFAAPTNAGTFGLAITMLSVKDMAEADSTGQLSGKKFDASDMAVCLAYAKTLGEKLSLGLNIKMISQKIEEEKASGNAIDAGLLYKASSKLDLGLAVQNVGNKITFINEGDPLPMTIKAGGAFKVMDALKVSLDISMPNDADASVGLGAEYSIKAGEKIMIPVRAGYKTGYETENLSGLAAGAGIQYNDVMGLDFAWIPMGILGDTMKLGFSFKF